MRTLHVNLLKSYRSELNITTPLCSVYYSFPRLLGEGRLYSQGVHVYIVSDFNTYSTLQVYQRSNSQVRHIPPKMSDKCPTNLRVNTL